MAINSTFIGGRWTNITLISAAVSIPNSNRIFTQTFTMKQSSIKVRDASLVLPRHAMTHVSAQQTDIVIIDAIDLVSIDKASTIDVSRRVKSMVRAALSLLPPLSTHRLASGGHPRMRAAHTAATAAPVGVWRLRILLPSTMVCFAQSSSFV